MANKKIRLLFLTLSLLLLSLEGCTRCHDSLTSLWGYQYPNSKIWAHGASTIDLGRSAESLFDGMEIDLNYSEYQDQLFLGHELYDTLKGLTFEAWLDSLHHPQSNHYWLDMKNLTPQNASRISHLIRQAASQHGILRQVMVESQDHIALKTVRDSGLFVILWVENTWWSGRSEEEWAETLRKQIKELKPDALSGDYHMFPQLPNAFPNENIHIWDTPREYNDTNVAHSRLIAAHPSVKVVLVDYPEPFDID